MGRQVNVKLKPKKAYSEQLKSGAQFYSGLLRFFVAFILIGVIALGYLYFWLYRYEKQSVNGALTQYVKDVTDRNWDKVYYDDQRYFTELNTKESVIDFLLYVYGDKKPGGMTFSWRETSGNTQYYDCYYRQSYISTLEATRPEGSKVWKVRTLIGSNNYEIDSINGSTFRINGVPITPDYEHEENHVPGAYEGYDLDEKLPSVTRYFISNLAGTPAIQTEDESHMSVRDWSAFRYYIGPKPTPEQYSDFANEISDTAMAYCEYITEDGTLYDLTQHLLPGTVFYDAVRSFDNQWFTTHDSIDYQNVEITGVMPLGDNAFIGSISFDYVVTAPNVSQTYSNSYQMYFVKDNEDLWKCINIYTISSDTSTPEIPEDAGSETAEETGETAAEPAAEQTAAPAATAAPAPTETAWTPEPVWTPEPTPVPTPEPTPEYYTEAPAGQTAETTEVYTEPTQLPEETATEPVTEQTPAEEPAEQNTETPTEGQIG